MRSGLAPDRFETISEPIGWRCRRCDRHEPVALALFDKRWPVVVDELIEVIDLAYDHERTHHPDTDLDAPDRRTQDDHRMTLSTTRTSA